MKNSAADRVAQFVEDLLKGRRPRRFEATAEEAEAMSAAAGLAAAHVGADLPDKAALDRIHRRPGRRLADAPPLKVATRGESGCARSDGWQRPCSASPSTRS
jgi:hypothetical protein